MRTVLDRRAAYAKSFPSHVDFDRYLARRRTDDVALRHVDAGDLEVPSGQIVVADPFYVTEDFTQPLDRDIAPGRYPVELTLADLGSWGARVAFAVLHISNEPVIRWQLAQTKDPSDLNVFFGVDAGLACFADLATSNMFAQRLRSFAASEPQGNYYDDVLARDVPPEANWGVHYPDPSSDLNLVVFSSGLGDGLYSSYWGIDASEAPARLVIDFQLFDHEGTIVRAD